MEFIVRFTSKVANGRITIPYRVTTLGTDGREGERNGFFAAHLLRSRAVQVPELIFHAPLDNTGSAYSFGDGGLSFIEVRDFVKGHIGQALGANSEGLSFDISGSIFPDAGTFSIWIKPSQYKYSAQHGLLRIRGHGWPFIGIYTDYIVTCNQPYFYKLSDRAGEWVHIAMRWDLEYLAYYIDGIPVYKGERLNYEIPTGELWGIPMKLITFDDIRIYSVPLSDEKIAALAEII